MTFRGAAAHLVGTEGQTFCGMKRQVARPGLVRPAGGLARFHDLAVLGVELELKDRIRGHVWHEHPAILRIDRCPRSFRSGK